MPPPIFCFEAHLFSERQVKDPVCFFLAKMIRQSSVFRLRRCPAWSSRHRIGIQFLSSRLDTADTAPAKPPSSLPPPQFYVPRKDRGHRPVFEEDTLPNGETRLARNSRQCPTRELYYLHGQWGRHKSPYRKWRHVTTIFHSSPFQRLLFPDLFGVGTIAALLTYYNEFLVGTAPEFATAISMNPTAFAGATTAIGLLAGFRLNNSYGRYNEARKAWSDTQGILRNMARQLVMYVPNECEDQKIRLLHLCQAFPYTLLFHLNDKGCHYNMRRLRKLGDEQFNNRVQAEFEAELSDVYQCDEEAHHPAAQQLLQRDLDRLCRLKSQKGHVPLEVLICMGEALATINTSNCMNVLFVKNLDDQIQSLTKAMGTCERIGKTPLPTGFTRHSSRLLFLWSHSLPLALYPLLGPWGALPTSLLTTYAVLGIEDISVQLEEPFDILPLRQFSNTMYDSIHAVQTNYHVEHVAVAAENKKDVSND